MCHNTNKLASEVCHSSNNNANIRMYFDNKNIIKLFLKYFLIQYLIIHLHQLNHKYMDGNKKPVGRPKEKIKKIAVVITKYYYPIELKKKGGADAIRLRMREACKKI